MKIILTLSTLQVELSRFTEPSFPRVPAVEAAKLEYSISGNAIGSGTYYEAPHLWAFGAVCTPEEADVVSAIYAEFESQRRAGGVASIILQDQIQEFVEKAPRTRQLASNATERITNGYVYYYASFRVWFTQFPQQEIAAKKRIIKMAFQETTKILR